MRPHVWRKCSVRQTDGICYRYGNVAQLWGTAGTHARQNKLPLQLQQPGSGFAAFGSFFPRTTEPSRAAGTLSPPDAVLLPCPAPGVGGFAGEDDDGDDALPDAPLTLLAGPVALESASFFFCSSLASRIALRRMRYASVAQQHNNTPLTVTLTRAISTCRGATTPDGTSASTVYQWTARYDTIPSARGSMRPRYDPTSTDACAFTSIHTHVQAHIAAHDDNYMLATAQHRPVTVARAHMQLRNGNTHPG